MGISFDGQVAIITGAGGGLGRSHALELARRGAKVVVNDLGGAVDGTGGSSKAAEAVTEEILALGGEAIANGGSVSDRAGAKSMVADAMKAWGRVDILINNAGILRDSSFAKMQLDDFQVVVDVHLMGSAYCAHAVWPIMLEQGYGRILMTSSPAALVGNFGQTNYAAAKQGVVGMMQAMKLEGGRKNIRTNTIIPWAATRMSDGILPEDIAAKLPPERVTAAAAYLVSEDAPNGTIMQAQGARYSTFHIMENEGVKLDGAPNCDDVAAAFEQIANTETARPCEALTFDL